MFDNVNPQPDEEFVQHRQEFDRLVCSHDDAVDMQEFCDGRDISPAQLMGTEDVDVGPISNLSRYGHDGPGTLDELLGLDDEVFIRSVNYFLGTPIKVEVIREESHGRSTDGIEDEVNCPPPKPARMEVYGDEIADELRRQARWICWQYKLRGSKWTKAPINAATGNCASTNKPETWTTFEHALEVHESGRLDTDGIGFVLTAGDNIVGIDLDDCRDPDTGKLFGLAQYLVEELDSYCEVSPSGTGVKVFIHGTMGMGGSGKRRKLSWDDKHPGEIEVYETSRFFTVTGNVFGDKSTLGKLSDGMKGELKELLGLSPKPQESASDVPGTSWPQLPPDVDMSDETVVARIRAAKKSHADLFARLYDRGDISQHNHDASNADFALAGILHFWTRGDAAQIERIMRKSKLAEGRDKWDTRRGDISLLQYTIRNLLADKNADPETDVWNPSNGESNRNETGGEPVRHGTHRELAAAFRERIWETLVYFQSEYYDWRGGAYRRVENELVTGRLWEFLDDCTKFNAKGEEIPLQPTETLVKSVRTALRGLSLKAAGTDTPCWIDGHEGPNPADILAFPNGQLNVRTGEFMNPTPRFFTRNAVEFDYDPEAPAPVEWLKFLDDLWADDPDCIMALQEFAGYLLTPDTRMHKMLLLIGKRRGGKSTILKMIRRLVGKQDVVSPSLSSMARQFGLQPFEGKRLAIFPDAQLGAFSDRSQVVENLLRISGEDAVSIERKQLPNLHDIELPTRILLTMNMFPALPDQSGALASRLLVLPATVTFKGREDRGLFDRLEPELPGVLLWALEGLKRLRANGGFTEPRSGLSMAAEIEDDASPVNVFIREQCLLGDGCRVSTKELYEFFARWYAQGQGKDGRCMTQQSFGRALRAVEPGIKKTNMSGGGKMYSGIALDSTKEPLMVPLP